MAERLTQELLIRVLPKQMRKSVNTELVDSINNIIEDSTIRDVFRENILSYTSVMKDGKFKMQSYLEAVHYVSYKLFGSSNVEAYTKTFPHRYQKFLDQGTSQKDVASYVTAYNKNKLVNLIYEQTLVPSYILNADLYQRALNVNADLMQNAKSEKVRADAANSLLTHLKMPETTKIELDVSLKEDQSITDLRRSTMELVSQQQEMLRAGAMNAKDIAHSKLLIEEVEYSDVTK